MPEISWRPPQTYVYKPLEEGHIRVVYIHGAEKLDESLFCTIKHRPVRCTGEFNPYFTLSYAWGETYADGSHLNRWIYTEDGAIISITASLDLALRKVRLMDQLGVLTEDVYALPQSDALPPVWIDAICINQSDTNERNQQVERMAEIYANSSRLIIWIGPTPTSYGSLKHGNDLRLRRHFLYQSIIESLWFKRRWVIQGKKSYV